MAAAKKLDLQKDFKSDYTATKKPAIARIRRARYLAIGGRGEPGGDMFQKQLAALYTVAYTIKMAKKAAGRDFRVMMLEGLWWPSSSKSASEHDHNWSWKLMVRVPTFVGARDLKAAIAGIVEEGKAKAFPIAKVSLDDFAEGKCIQVLHVGAFENEPDTILKMHEFAESQGLHLHGKHHEIYMSDPRRVKPDRAKTILRYPVK